MATSTFDYVTYIRTTPDKLWSALTDPELMKQYWFGMGFECRWTPGSPWKMLFPDGKVCDSGAIVAAEPQRRLVIRWQNQWKPELTAEGQSLCTLEIEPSGAAVKLRLSHSMERESSKLIATVSDFWPMIIANLKSMLETGEIALHNPG